MKKHLLASMMVGAMAVSVLSGCGAAEINTVQTNTVQTTKSTEVTQPVETTAAHVHEGQENWEKNGTEHWMSCACGEKLETGVHELDEFWICKTCGSEIMDFGDIDVSDFDEYGNVLSRKTFSVDGELLSETSYEREYDEAGNILAEKYFDNGVLREEDTYSSNEDGGLTLASAIYHYEDGSKGDCRYDENGNLIAYLYYNADGVLESQEYTEYAYTDDGICYEEKLTAIYGDGSKIIAEYNVYGDILTRDKFEEDGSVVFSEVYNYGYNDEGQTEWIKEYRNGLLAREVSGYTLYEGAEYSVRYPENIIEYYEDGTKLVMRYGTRSDLESEILYAADGTVVDETTYTYECDEKDNYLDKKTYKNGTLIIHREFAVNEDGWSNVKTETEYLENGGKIVREYDEFGEQISETEYDAEGNVIRK